LNWFLYNSELFFKEFVELLLKNGSKQDINNQDEDGDTPVIVGNYSDDDNNKVKVLELLIVYDITCLNC
jgi:hypothetical protein